MFYRLFWHAFRAPKIGPFGPGRCSGGPGRPCFRGFGADPGRLLPVGGRISGPRATGSAPSNALQSVGEDSSPRGSWGVWTHQLRFGGSNSMDLRVFCRPHWGALGPPNPPLRAWGGVRGVRGRRWGRQAPSLDRNSPHSTNADMHTCIRARVRRRTVGASRRVNGTDVRKCARHARKGWPPLRNQASLRLSHCCIIWATLGGSTRPNYFGGWKDGVVSA